MIGDRIKQARLALGYSAEQVAAFLKVSPATVYRYENGDISKLPSKFIQPLAEFLCVTPSWLMGWSDDSGRSAEDAARLEALHQDPRLCLLFDRSRKMKPEDVDTMLAVAASILKERDGE